MNKQRTQSVAQYLLLVATVATATIALRQTSAQETTANPATIYTGNAAAGKKLFDAPGNCITCHRVGAAGAFYGPNLSDVASRISPAGMRTLLNSPPATVKPENRLYEITLSNGKTVRGKLLNQGPISLQLLTTDGRLVAYPRSTVRSGHFVDPPHMPSYKDSLTGNQIADLVAYLSSLRTPEN
jgi:putative heme-binding domain-containing protein